VVVERHRFDAEFVGERAHCQRSDSRLVGDREARPRALTINITASRTASPERRSHGVPIPFLPVPTGTPVRRRGTPAPACPGRTRLRAPPLMLLSWKAAGKLIVKTDCQATIASPGTATERGGGRNGLSGARCLLRWRPVPTRRAGPVGACCPSGPHFGRP
jgi:hypothetical protein